MNAQLYQTPSGWTAMTRHGKLGYSTDSRPSRDEALSELALMVKAFTGQDVEFDEVEIVDAPVLPESALKPKTKQLSFNLKIS